MTQNEIIQQFLKDISQVKMKSQIPWSTGNHLVTIIHVSGKIMSGTMEGMTEWQTEWNIILYK